MDVDSLLYLVQMTIKQNQVVASKEVLGNQFSAIPRDLRANVGHLQDANESKASQAQVDSSNDDSTVAVYHQAEAETIVRTNPPTPYLVSIKSQTVNPKPDGTFTVDVVLDVSGTTIEYEVRISKDEGNI